MDRRTFCRAGLSSAATLALGTHAASAQDAAPPDDPAPWTLGFAGVQHDLPAATAQWRGRLPDGLRGTLYRNGPARHALGGVRYHHWFDGDGMVQQYTLDAAGVVHQGRFVRTGKFLADSAAGRPVRIAFGTPVDDAEPLRSADDANVANTSVLHHQGELLALWEGGSATRLDPRTLATRGLKTWSAELGGMPFSAHPRREPDGTLWNFGLVSPMGMLAVYRIAPSGEVAQSAVLPIPDIGMVHDFAVTARHLVFLVPPLVFEPQRWRSGATFLDSHAWRPELGLRVLVLPKDHLDAPRWFELPAGFVFHIGNACEQAGVLRLDCMRSATPWNVTTGFRGLMRGEGEERDPAALTLVEIDLAAGRARQQVLPLAGEFPCIDPRRVGRSYRHVFAAERQEAGGRPGFDAVMRVDVTTGAAQRYRFGTEVMVEEHVFVPDPARGAREGGGWLVGTALDLRRRATLLSVFDAERLADGPLAQAVLGRALPLGFHGTFVRQA